MVKKSVNYDICDESNYRNIAIDNILPEMLLGEYVKA